jgi:hypothetical protein
MLNIIVFLLYYVLLCINVIYAVVWNKQQVLDIDVEKYRGVYGDQCPDYSQSDIPSNDWCNYSFYCKGDICATKNENNTIQLQSNSTTVEEYIIDVCEPSKFAYSGCYQKVPCKSDSHCLSNKCLNSTCVANKDSPVIKCMDNYYYEYFTFRGRGKIYCGLTDGEYCKNNRDCASNECFDNICATFFHDHSYDGITKYIIFGLAVMILVIILISYFRCCRIKGKKRNVVTV